VERIKPAGPIFDLCNVDLTLIEPNLERFISNLVAGLDLVGIAVLPLICGKFFLKYTRFSSSFTGTYVSISAVIFPVCEIRAFVGIVVLPLVCGKFFLMYLVLVEFERDLRDYCCSRLDNLLHSRFCWDFYPSARLR